MSEAGPTRPADVMAIEAMEIGGLYLVKGLTQVMSPVPTFISTPYRNFFMRDGYFLYLGRVPVYNGYEYFHILSLETGLVGCITWQSALGLERAEDV